MAYEVELKFHIDQPDQILAELRRRRTTEQGSVEHVDRYFNHPSRDYRTTDEAFRIRSIGVANFLTYKGAVLGSIAKTRREIEVPFAEGIQATEQLIEMVHLLGFRFVREVRKTRMPLTLDWNGHTFEIALDEVPGLGCFLEIELVVDDEQRETAEAAVWELARSLPLSTVEPRSYLDMLLVRDG